MNASDAMMKSELSLSAASTATATATAVGAVSFAAAGVCRHRRSSGDGGETTTRHDDVVADSAVEPSPLLCLDGTYLSTSTRNQPSLLHSSSLVTISHHQSSCNADQKPLHLDSAVVVASNDVDLLHTIDAHRSLLAPSWSFNYAPSSSADSHLHATTSSNAAIYELAPAVHFNYTLQPPLPIHPQLGGAPLPYESGAFFNTAAAAAATAAAAAATTTSATTTSMSSLSYAPSRCNGGGSILPTTTFAAATTSRVSNCLLSNSSDDDDDVSQSSPSSSASTLTPKLSRHRTTTTATTNTLTVGSNLPLSLGFNSSLSPFDTFCTVPGRTSLLSQVTKYNVSVGEIQRRISPPECLNASLLGGILRKAKSKDGGKALRESLRQIGLALPAGRRKSAHVTALTALVEEEAVHMARDFHGVCERDFPAKEIALYLGRHVASDEDAHRRHTMLHYVRLFINELTDLMNADRTPVCGNRPEVILDASIQKPLTHFSMVTHGFGGLVIVSVLDALNACVHESFRLLDRTPPSNVASHYTMHHQS